MMLSLMAIVGILTMSSSSSSSSFLWQQRNIVVVAFSTIPTRMICSKTRSLITPRITTLGSSSSSDNIVNVNGIGGNRSEKKPTIRKRRFLQQAHPVSDAAINNASAIAEPRRKQQIRQTGTSDEVIVTTTITNTEQPENTRISPPLRTNKSIEELEAILEKRFGSTTNSLISPSPQPKKKMNAMANRVLDPWAKEENMIGNNVRATKTTSPALGNTKSSTIRSTTSTARDIDIQKSKRGKGIDDYDANETQLSPRQSQRQGQLQQRTFNREDAMLNKVRLNQERLQSKKKIGSGSVGEGEEDANYDTRQTNKNSNYRYNDSSLPIISVSRRDYYDEDDEGYEEAEERGKTGRKNGGRKEIYENNDLPKAENWHEKRTKKSSSSSSVVSSGGGIFFSNTRSTSISQQNSQERQKQQRVLSPNGESAMAKTATKNAKMDSDDTKEVKRLKRKDPVSLPLLDEDGQEMFLTLEQADKIVKNILSSTQSASLDSDEESSMGNNDRKNEHNSDNNDINQWEDIGITDPALLSNLRSSNKLCCPCPLAAQDRACPPIVAGNDVLLSTHTGSGKTLAFLAPIAQSLLINGVVVGGGGGSGAYPKAIVIAPGRELASQIVSVAQTLFADTGLTVALAIGGTPYSRNVEKLRKMKPDVVVGTPGRIAELIIGRPEDNGGKLKISGLQTIVLDEFDALLQYDAHVEPTMAILKAVDRQHGQSLQRVFCSATASDMLGGKDRNENADIESYLRPGYAHASVDENDLLVTSGVQTKLRSGGTTTSVRVSKTTIHGTLHVPSRRLALEAVRKVLNTNPSPQQALIFVDSPRRVDIVIDKLAEMDIVAAPLHGGANSGKGDRAEVNKALREGYVGIVVATEMAARGIDAPYLTHVINLDLPTDASHYAHRAGRCGRGGRPGVAISITCDVREKGVPKRLAEELGIIMYNVEAKEGKLRIIQ